jgi:hypothetical protein
MEVCMSDDETVPVRYPARMCLRAPEGLAEALEIASRRRHTNPSEFARQAILGALAADGVALCDGLVELRGQSSPAAALAEIDPAQLRPLRRGDAMTRIATVLLLSIGLSMLAAPAFAQSPSAYMKRHMKRALAQAKGPAAVIPNGMDVPGGPRVDPRYDTRNAARFFSLLETAGSDSGGGW